ncbi:hypothetical protein Pint_33148 [Pistacia integerrima]|uniref:Uncharacterized protein n=1 Tax=Pistacia integerrima TaxID=434235 RepID=A0ACC0X6W7_9ROSI|nr:hypothetical protein Pint_33148 [Pistacia integerrima]
MYSAFEDASTSGTVVYRGQHDEPDSTRTPKSRLGIQERISSVPLEDSSQNLGGVFLFLKVFVFCKLKCVPLSVLKTFHAKAAIQSGLRKGNPRERLGLGKINNDGEEYRRREQIASSSDSSRYNAPTSEVPGTTLMHKEHFLDHTKQVMIKIVQE